ncbi:hypothetical protein GGTG_07358 [Gaeumannomyces tritici R3-111a-1]|uniref:Uncharacterized protein n=1 Tax=Gaeumannomyces tritici (strain R3-111a-1) TaxID=644352 RepID=J3P1G1_GAET3|nr:hypothetical protein GGTG_07358 [Gaeumannomyces tritici R3-111a-1]EJT77446.1 hypothetical protein GGTG_07358 [Gaeumannomyces tritici R3-111a-1]
MKERQNAARPRALFSGSRPKISSVVGARRSHSGSSSKGNTSPDRNAFRSLLTAVLLPVPPWADSRLRREADDGVAEAEDAIAAAVAAATAEGGATYFKFEHPRKGRPGDCGVGGDWRRRPLAGPCGAWRVANSATATAAGSAAGAAPAGVFPTGPTSSVSIRSAC